MRNVLNTVRGRYDVSLGAHVEMNCDGLLFESGARFQPREMPLQQPPEALEQLCLCLERPFINRHFALFPKANL